MVALYIATDCFKVEMTAKIKSTTLRTIRRAVMPNSRWVEELLNELLQKEKSITWITVTGEKDGGRQRATYEIPV